MEPIETITISQNHPAQEYKAGETIFEIAKTDSKLVSPERQRFIFALEVMKSYSDRFRRLKDIITL